MITASNPAGAGGEILEEAGLVAPDLLHALALGLQPFDDGGLGHALAHFGQQDIDLGHGLATG